MLGRSALVLYGSETGNAQDVAEEIGRLCERLHFDVKVTELNAVSLNELLQYNVVIFSISTTGQGDIPGNGQLFWKKLKSFLSTVYGFVLETIKYLAKLTRFNYAHRKLYNRIKQLGGQPFFERGESDEQHPEGIDGAFLAWIVKLRHAILDYYPLPPAKEPIADDVLLPPNWELHLDTTIPDVNDYQTHKIEDNHDAPPATNGHTPITTTTVPLQDPKPENPSILKHGRFTATLLSNKRVTPTSHWQDVRLFEFAAPYLDYKPGDVLTIYPQNASEAVDEFLSIMKWTQLADELIVFTPSPLRHSSSPQIENNAPYPSHLTLRSLITNHLDLNAIPRRSFFVQIAHFTKDEFQKQRLLEFTNPEYVDELFDYTTRPRRSILEVLQEFDTVHIPLKWVASVLPAIRGRQFSIASSGNLKRALVSGTDARGTVSSDGRIQLLVAIVRYRTVIKKIREGLCSRYMAALQPGAQLDVVLSKGGMKLAFDKPAIMVGPGTGIAPLRAMIHERAALAGPDAFLETLPKQLLFFGARNRAADYFFEEEWEELRRKMPLEVFAAFSRDKTPKTYVQDMIRKHSKEVYNVLQAQGVVYLCGSSGKMPQAVREALIEVIQSEGGQERFAAEAELIAMEKNGRYQQETW